MLELFPELKDSTNIFFIEPTKKGLRRFRSSELLPGPLEEAMWAHTLLDTRIRQNVKEVASLRLGRVPALLDRLNKTDDRHEDTIRQQQAIMKSRGYTEWKQCRLEIMKDFLLPSEQNSNMTVINGAGSRHSEESDLKSSATVRTSNLTTKSLPGADFWANDDATKKREQAYPGQNFWDDQSP